MRTSKRSAPNRTTLADLAGNWFGTSIQRSGDLEDWTAVPNGPTYGETRPLNQIWTGNLWVSRDAGDAWEELDIPSCPGSSASRSSPDGEGDPSEAPLPHRRTGPGCGVTASTVGELCFIDGEASRLADPEQVIHPDTTVRMIQAVSGG